MKIEILREEALELLYLLEEHYLEEGGHKTLDHFALELEGIIDATEPTLGINVGEAVKPNEKFGG